MNNHYSKETIKRFSNPTYFGKTDNPDGIGKVGNPKCGDQMTVYIKVKDGKIEKASFETLGCAAAIATSDVVCEMIEGETLEKAASLKESEMIRRLEKLPAVKVHCSSFAIEGVKKAIENYKNGKK